MRALQTPQATPFVYWKGERQNDVLSLGTRNAGYGRVSGTGSRSSSALLYFTRILLIIIASDDSLSSMTLIHLYGW